MRVRPQYLINHGLRSIGISTWQLGLISQAGSIDYPGPNLEERALEIAERDAYVPLRCSFASQVR